MTSIKAAKAARQQLEAQAQRLAELTEYGTPGNPDEYALQRLADVYNLHKMTEA